MSGAHINPHQTCCPRGERRRDPLPHCSGASYLPGDVPTEILEAVTLPSWDRGRSQAREKPRMLILRLRRAGRDRGPSQLRSLTLPPQMSCGFNCHRPRLPACPQEPQYRTAARAGAEPCVKQPLPEHPTASSRQASSAGKRSLRGRETGWSYNSSPGPAGRPPGEVAQHIPAITAEQSILREGIPALLAHSLCSPGADETLLSARRGVDVWPGTSAAPGQSAVWEQGGFSSSGSPAGGWQGDKGWLLSFRAC